MIRQCIINFKVRGIKRSWLNLRYISEFSLRDREKSQNISLKIVFQSMFEPGTFQIKVIVLATTGKPLCILYSNTYAICSYYLNVQPK
jgi:hypothetical protein